VSGNGRSPAALPSWLLDPLLAGESVYVESVDYDHREELRQAIGFDLIPGVTFAVPLHPDERQVLTIGAPKPLSALERREIEHLAKVVEMTLGSMELTKQLRSSQDALHQRSNYDRLTRLPNSELLWQRLERALADGDRQVGLLFIDLDHFNTINDSLGVLAGDEALVTVARRLAGSVRPGDTVARFGSDEFGVLLDRIDDPTEPEAIARRIVEALSAPITGLHTKGTDVFVRASIGLAVSGPTTRDPLELTANADVAMHAAKADEGAVYRVFEPAMRATALDRVELESGLHRALERDELVVHYQPVVSLVRGKVVGVEALARWHHPERGLIPTVSFIRVAEESGLINQIGEWILREGCRQLRAWSAADPELDGLFLNVNLSPRQFAQADLVHSVGKIIGEVGIDPSRLTLELTEGALVEDTQANLDKLKGLKALGVRLAVDDFGTGFSSLAYLQRFPFDILKVDRAFVHGVDLDEDAAAIARAIISMGQALGLACVAEGVETRRQLDWLRDASCDSAQGHLFAPAMPPDQLLPLLTSDLPWFSRSA
jgi:Amt family ammonium transporter